MSSNIINTELDGEFSRNVFFPHCLDQFIGQDQIKEVLRVSIAAAKLRHESLDHVLIAGKPGMGKTTLVNIIASEMGAKLKSTSASILETHSELAAVLSNLQTNDILFIDEIHLLDQNLEETLCRAMKYRVIDVMFGKGSSARSVRLPLPEFTVIGETSHKEKLSPFLRDSFDIQVELELYDPEEILTILTFKASELGVQIERSGASVLAHYSQGRPYFACRLLRRARDFAQITAGGIITQDIAEQTVQALGLNENPGEN